MCIRDRTESWNGSSWTEVNDLNSSRAGLGGKGSSTATLVFGGSPPTPSYNAATEDWNGVSWQEVADLNTARLLTSGAAGYTSTTTAGLAFGGEIVPGTVQSATEEWSGSSNTTKTITTD